MINVHTLPAQDRPPDGESVWALDIGFHYMLESSVNIRSQPNLQGAVIGRLALHDRIEILDGMPNPQKINNMWAYWYRIRHNNLEGYIWGGFIAKSTLIFDIDGNGQPDFFQHRITSTAPIVFHLDPERDIFIYINGRRISTANVGGGGWWSGVTFEPEDNTVIMTLHTFGASRSYWIDANGRIGFIEQLEWESEF